MPAQKITLSEGLAGAAFVIATFGVSLAVYRLIADFQEGTIAIGISGWHYTFAVLPWLFVLLCAAAVIARRIPGLPSVARRALPFVAPALAGLALVLVIVAFADRPDQRELSVAIVQHVDRDEIEEVAAQALDWTPIGTGIAYGAGLYLVAVGAVLALVATALQLAAGRSRRPAPEAGIDTVAPAGSVSPPAAATSGTAGAWQAPVAPLAVAPTDVAKEAASSAAAPAPAGTEPPGAAATPGAGQDPVPLTGPGTLASRAPEPQAEAPGTEPPGVATDETEPQGFATDETEPQSAAAGAGSADAATDETEPPEASAAGAAPSAAYCVRCGAPYRSADERFCTRCGAPRWTG
jgi:hypothetical protein